VIIDQPLYGINNKGETTFGVFYGGSVARS
jgi:hypothetical protein